MWQNPGQTILQGPADSGLQKPPPPLTTVRHYESSTCTRVNLDKCQKSAMLLKTGYFGQVDDLDGAEIRAGQINGQPASTLPLSSPYPLLPDKWRSVRVSPGSRPGDAEMRKLCTE